MPKKSAPIVISLGGSLIVPGDIDTKFLKDLNRLIRALVKDGHRFVLITGGGKTARNYQGAAREVIKLKDEDIDWLGIHATRINAHLIRTIFHDLASPKIISHPLEKFDWKEPILVAAGWKPGFSTDYDAVLLANRVEAKTIVNLSNISHVYSDDPKINKSAKPVDSISWNDYRSIIPKEWKPGLNSPFDPIASKAAQKNGLRVLITNGADLNNLKKALFDKAFSGTVIG